VKLNLKWTSHNVGDAKNVECLQRKLQVVKRGHVGKAIGVRLPKFFGVLIMSTNALDAVQELQNLIVALMGLSLALISYLLPMPPLSLFGMGTFTLCCHCIL
jgi:hypothetical protein